MHTRRIFLCPCNLGDQVCSWRCQNVFFVDARLLLLPSPHIPATPQLHPSHVVTNDGYVCQSIAGSLVDQTGTMTEASYRPQLAVAVPSRHHCTFAHYSGCHGASWTSTGNPPHHSVPKQYNHPKTISQPLLTPRSSNVPQAGPCKATPSQMAFDRKATYPLIVDRLVQLLADFFANKTQLNKSINLDVAGTYV